VLPFGCADKPAEIHYWLICCERKILFRLKNKLKKTDYKPNQQDQYSTNLIMIGTFSLGKAPILAGNERKQQAMTMDRIHQISCAVVVWGTSAWKNQ
jgi:hypothetical protein